MLSSLSDEPNMVVEGIPKAHEARLPADNWKVIPTSLDSPTASTFIQDGDISSLGSSHYTGSSISVRLRQHPYHLTHNEEAPESASHTSRC